MQITDKQAKSILSATTGYIKAGGFDFTLNPYTGCQFGCFYCYAAFFSATRQQQESWGDWVEVKANAVALMRRLGNRIAGKTIFMSSVTDPYQGIEKRLRLSRQLLEEMLPHQPRLVIQTRSPYVTRDIDLLRQFRNLRVNMTITTDDDNVRKAFEPRCASIERRFAAIEQIEAAGIKTGITLTPLLPVLDADAFGRRLAAVQADVYVTQFFQMGQARFAAGTREEARQLAQTRHWHQAAYDKVKATLTLHLPQLYEGKEGFMPE